MVGAALTLAIILSGAGIYRLYTLVLKFRTRGLLTDLGPIRPNAVTLVYFTTPTCIPCKTVQRPAIRTLSQTLGSSLQVVEIDAIEHPELADRWGVMSVPTFIIDPRGKLRHVNHGGARTEKLLMQVHEAA